MLRAILVSDAPPRSRTGHKSLGAFRIVGQHARQGIVGQNAGFIGPDRQRLFIGPLRFGLATELIIGNAQRRIHGPVAGLQLLCAGQEVHRFLGAAHGGQRLAIFADHALIVGRDHHQLRQMADGFGIIAVGAQKLRLADAAVQRFGRLYRGASLHRFRAGFGLGVFFGFAEQPTGLRRAAKRGLAQQKNCEHGAETGVRVSHGGQPSRYAGQTLPPPGQQTLKYVGSYRSNAWLRAFVNGPTPDAIKG
jgi:hypothetical protein